jgi:hypothetical protein
MLRNRIARFLAPKVNHNVFRPTNKNHELEKIAVVSWSSFIWPKNLKFFELTKIFLLKNISFVTRGGHSVAPQTTLITDKYVNYKTAVATGP